MSSPREDDRDAVDAAFAEMMASYHLTADRSDPMPEGRESAEPAEEVGTSWADTHPLFAPPPTPGQPEVEPEEDRSRFVPEQPAPIPRPAWPVLLGWLSLGYSILFMLVAVLGVGLPRWAGWLAVVGFLTGMGVLFARLPRTRPPGAGDGAVV